MESSSAPAVGSYSENFGWVLTISLVVPGALVVMTLLFLFYVRPEQWSSGAIYGSFAISISFVTALIPVVMAVNRLPRRAGSHTGRNIFLTAVGVLALLPKIFIVVVLAIGLIRVV
jgi:hypothetical protein